MLPPHSIRATARQVAYPASNGHVETRSYDRAGRLTSVKHLKGTSTLAKATYTLDAVGNPTKIGTEDGTVTYTYNPKDFLTEVCYQERLCESDRFLLE
jgi:YD repeat-containing protein